MMVVRDVFNSSKIHAQFNQKYLLNFPIFEKYNHRSKFIETKAYLKEKEANKFLYRGTFGTAPRGPLSPPLNRGLNEDPSPPPNTLSSVLANAFRTDIKNAANTHVISFGGKVLALFEAGLPHRIDPVTLDTIGEDDMSGTLIEDKVRISKIDIYLHGIVL